MPSPSYGLYYAGAVSASFLFFEHLAVRTLMGSIM